MVNPVVGLLPAPVEMPWMSITETKQVAALKSSIVIEEKKNLTALPIPAQ